MKNPMESGQSAHWARLRGCLLLTVPAEHPAQRGMTEGGSQREDGADQHACPHSGLLAGEGKPVPEPQGQGGILRVVRDQAHQPGADE